MKAAFRLEEGDCDDVAGQLSSMERAGATLVPTEFVKWQVLADLLAGKCDVRQGRLDGAGSMRRTPDQSIARRHLGSAGG
ncbi:MAG: hypothetical protein H0W08_06570 [Acidobacteria bacterium]|nr:hypothetical protein [Acidobacteriota bacterium]